MSDIIPGCRERTNFISMREKYGQTPDEDTRLECRNVGS